MKAKLLLLISVFLVSSFAVTAELAVEITNPPLWAVINKGDIIIITGQVEDTGDLYTLELYINTEWHDLPFSLPIPDPYTFTYEWDTSTYATGGYTLQVNAEDYNSNYAWDEVDVVLVDPANRPVVTITSPEAGAYNIGTVIATAATVTDVDGDLNKVVRTISGPSTVPADTRTFTATGNYNYVADWDTANGCNGRCTPGSYTVYVTGYDTIGDGNDTVAVVLQGILTLDVTEPAASLYTVGASVPIAATMSYSETGGVTSLDITIEDVTGVDMGYTPNIPLVGPPYTTTPAGLVFDTTADCNGAACVAGDYKIIITAGTNYADEAIVTKWITLEEVNLCAGLLANISLLSFNGSLYGCGLTAAEEICVASRVTGWTSDRNLSTCQSPAADSNFYCAAGLQMNYPDVSTNMHPDFLMFFEENSISGNCDDNPDKYGANVLALYQGDPITYTEAQWCRTAFIDDLICDSTEGCKWRRNKYWEEDNGDIKVTSVGDPSKHARYSNYSEGNDFRVNTNTSGFPDAGATVQACCPEEWLWNGTVCTPSFDQSVPEVTPRDFTYYHFLNRTNAWLPVIDGDDVAWRLYFNKTMWKDGDQFQGQTNLGKSGFCPGDDKCLYFIDINTQNCKEKGFYEGDHLCGEVNPSVWTSRSMSIATILLKIAESKQWSEYTLLCDDYIALYTAPDTPPPVVETKFNSTCILRHDDFVVTGSHLRKWVTGDEIPTILQRHNLVLEQFLENHFDLPGVPGLPQLIEYSVDTAMTPSMFNGSILNEIDVYQGSFSVNNHIFQSGAWLNDSSILLMSNKEQGTATDQINYDAIDVLDAKNVSTFLEYFPHLANYKKTAAGDPQTGYDLPDPDLDLGLLGSSFGTTSLTELLADYDSNQYSLIFKRVSADEPNIELVMEPKTMYEPAGSRNHYLYAYFEDLDGKGADLCNGLLSTYTEDYSFFPFGNDYAPFKDCNEKDPDTVAFFALVDPVRQQMMHNDGIGVSFIEHVWSDVVATERESSKCVVNKTWESIDPEIAYQYELSTLPDEYLIAEIKENQYLPFDNMKTEGCCWNTSCWNGFNCTAADDAFEINYGGETTTYVCSAGNWSSGKNRTNWAATDSNWCSDGESCWLPEDMFIEECLQHCEGEPTCDTDCEAEFVEMNKTLDGRSCTKAENFTFYRDHTCFDEGNWTTRTGLIAAKYREFIEDEQISDYVLFCDNYTNVLNYITYTGEAPVGGGSEVGDVLKYLSGELLGDAPGEEITKGNPTNNFCVLSYNDGTPKVAFGTSLNRMIAVPVISGYTFPADVTHPQVFMETVFPAEFSIPNIGYNVPEPSRNEFHNLQSEKVWLHYRLQMLIVNPSGMTLVPAPVSIWGHFIDPIQTVINWIQGIFFDQTIRGPERADIIYNAVSGYNTVDAFVDKREGSKSTGLVYKNINATMCDPLNRSIQSTDLECNVTGSEQDITSTEFDDIYQQWVYMTSRLRVQYGESTIVTTTTTPPTTQQQS